MRHVAVVVAWACCAVPVSGCAGVGEAVAGTCLALTLQFAVDVCVGVVCDDHEPAVDDDDDDDDDDVRAELPPAPSLLTGDAGEEVTDAACRLLIDEGRALRLGCVDGTSAVALGERSAEKSYPRGPRTVDGDVVIADAGDVAALSGVLAITGSLVVQSPVLLRLRLPSLRHVGGDVVIQQNPRLVRAELPALVDVGGVVRLRHNPALSQDPIPAVTHARTVDVVDNDALPLAAVDRLLSIPP